VNTGPWISISIALAITIMLITGMVVMYHTKAFWGLEDNTNANTINSTFNSVTMLGPILVVVVIVLAIVLLLPVRMGFG